METGDASSRQIGKVLLRKTAKEVPDLRTKRTKAEAQRRKLNFAPGSKDDCSTGCGACKGPGPTETGLTCLRGPGELGLVKSRPWRWKLSWRPMPQRGPVSLKVLAPLTWGVRR